LTRSRRQAVVRSACHCCGEAIELTVDSEAEVDPDSAPEGILLFVPAVDWERLSAPTIVPDY
jgi:hypothetical protein